jgi:trans-aconitate methyltransferase
MSDLWQVAGQASERLAAQALEYDRFRPRYPASTFDDIMELANLSAGSEAIEVGAGTGIGTEPLVERGLTVIAIEPAVEMAAVAEAKLSGRAEIFMGRLEDYAPQRSVKLVVSFNAWHWVEPAVGVERVARLIEPNGHLALIWTEVVSWGPEAFEKRLAEVSGSLWAKRLDHVDASMQPIRGDARFDEIQVRHHQFSHKLDAATFVAVTKTYGGQRTDEQYAAIEKIINDEFGGAVVKVEDAALYIARRR